MNELIKITYNEADEPVVSGRDLHEKLGIETQYTKWFSRMCEYGFEENKDYILVSQNCLTNNPKNPTAERTDHVLTLDAAKQLCMIQRSDIGRQFREYFIEVEKAWNSDEMVKSRALKIFERENKVLTEKNNYLEADNRKLADTVEELDKRVMKLTADKDYIEGKYREYRIKNYFTDFCIDNGEDLCIRDAAKEIGVKETDFTKLLVDKKYLYRKPSNNRLFPYASPKCRGVFVVKEVMYSGGLKYQTQTLITTAGRAKLTAECLKAGLLPVMPEQDSFLWEV